MLFLHPEDFLISALARTSEMSARIPVKENSNGPRTFIQVHPASDFSEFKNTEEGQTADNSSSVLLML